MVSSKIEILSSQIARTSVVLLRKRVPARRDDVHASKKLVVCAFALLSCAQAFGQIRITEYAYQSPHGEYVELTNVGAASVDMTGWSFDDNSNIAGSFSLTSFGVVAPGESVLITESTEATFRTGWGLGAGVKVIGGSGGVAALARNDALNIWDASSVLVDRLQYGDQDFPGSIRAQNPSGWVCAAGLGANNPQKWLLSAVGDSQGSILTSGGAIGSPGVFVSVACPTAPTVAGTVPTKRTAVATLPNISVTFSAAVTGVAAGNLTVNGSAATSVSGSGAGPYVFSGYAAPAVGSANIVMSSGSIVSQVGSIPFAGDNWTESVGVLIVINELNYHPHDTLDPGQLSEFVEFYNAGASTVDMSNWVTNGVTFTFPGGTTIGAGQYRVIAVNSVELQARTGFAGALQWTSGALSNSGETISVADSSGNVIDSVPYSDGGAWPSSPDGGGPSLELINPGLPNHQAGAWLPSLVNYGTPGAQNGNFDASPSPLIITPKHSPSIPAANAAMLVTATVLDDGASPPTVTLHYRQDATSPGAYSTAPMFDDGAHSDGAAGDNFFGATLAGLADGQQYDFYLTADDGASVSTFPTNHVSANPSCSATGCLENPSCIPCQTMLCKFSSEVLPTDFPVYHILVPRPTKNFQESISCNGSPTVFEPCKTEFDATFIDHLGNVFYNVTERYRGQSSISLNPRSYAVDFPSNTPLQSPLGFPVRKLILNGNQPTRQKLGFDIFGNAGLPTSRCEFVRLRYTGINYDVTAIGSNGYNGLHACIERPDNDFLDSQGGDVPDRGLTSEGNLYRGENTATFDWRGTDPAPYRVNAWGRNGYSKENNEELDVWTDLISILDAMNNSAPASYATNVAALLDEDACLKYFALHNILGNKEGAIYRDTGDDFYFYTNPPGHIDGYNAKFITWDTDSILTDSQTETIWRTGNQNDTIATIRNFVRNNAFAPIFVKDISDSINSGPLSIANFNARIDAMPNAAFFTSGGSDTFPATRAQFKAWYQNRVNFINNEIIDNLTLTGVPSSPYTNPNPVIAISGQLNQAGTHNVTVNGQPVTFSVFSGTWSSNLTLYPGINKVVVTSYDRNAAEMQSITSSVLYDPAVTTPGLKLTVPNRMVDSKTLTLKAEVLDASGAIDWHTCGQVGTVSAVRLSDNSPVPTSVTVFETLAGGAGSGGPAPDSIRFYNGVGSVSITLDTGAATPPGDILVTVTLGSFSATKIVEVLDGDLPGLYRNLSGTLSGANLTWGPSDGVIHLTGSVTVSSGVLTIQPGTIIMVDSGPVNDGTAILAQGGGTVNATGTQTQPIFFFPTAGPPAMALPQTQQNNDVAWRGIYHQDSGSSIYAYVFITGAGNAVVSSHPRPPILRCLNSHNLTLTDCVLADCPGMGTSALGGASGTYTFRRCLFSRLGIGGEWLGSGSTLLIEDSWFTRIGRAPEPNGVDGDILHVDRPGNSYTIRRSILTDCGDDMIDHSTGAQPVVENCIIYDARDKVVSIGPLVDGPEATITMTNCLIFNVPGGIRCAGAPAYLTNCTLGSNTNVNGQSCSSVIENSILWTNSADTCCGTVSYTIVGNAAHLGCGVGNLSSNPLFVSTGCNYNLQGGSPGLTAGPGGSQIGWLGFPLPSGCTVAGDCADGNACTNDACNGGICDNPPIANCTPCNTVAECNDANACTTDTCTAGQCVHTPIANCTPCTTAGQCNDSLLCTSDACTAGVCVYTPVSCPPGQSCNTGTGLCDSAPQTVTFRDGLNGYSATADTFIRQTNVTQNNGTTVDLRWDTEESGAGTLIYSLIRFDGIFGSNSGQIPPGSTITSASLTYTVGGDANAAGNNGELHETTVAWDESTVTYANFGGDSGVQVDEYSATNIATLSAASATSFTVSVTSSLAAWSANPAANLGWIVIPTGTDGVQVRSSDYVTTPSERPTLAVTFIAPGCTVNSNCDDSNPCTTDVCNTGVCGHSNNANGCNDGNICTSGDVCSGGTCAGTPIPGCCTSDVQCNDNNVCNGVETCQSGVCQSGAPLNCDDGIACTTDACGAGTGCSHTDNCINGAVCNLTTGICDSTVTVTFRQGVGGYTGAKDTFLNAGAPTANNSAVTPLVVDLAPNVEQVLLEFGGIFGSGAGQIPTSATIQSATLTIDVTNASAFGALLHRMLQAWNDTDNWNTFSTGGGGIQAGTEAASTADVSSFLNSTGTHTITVTNSVQTWLANPSSNFGWAWLPPTQDDSWQFSSSEAATVTLRPMLSVTYVVSAPVPDAPDVSAVGSRYLSITPAAGQTSVALRIDSTALGCMPRYVDQNGLLGSSPVFQSSAAWGTVLVADREVIPDTSYEVQADVRNPSDPENLSDAVEATTWAWGDTNDDLDVNLFDIVCVLDGFQDIFLNCDPSGVDLQGATPNRDVDLFDITAVLDSFQSLPYPDSTPCAAFRSTAATESVSESVLLRLVAEENAARPGDIATVHVFADGVSDLRAYQLAFDVIDMDGQPIEVESVWIDENRNDYVFLGRDSALAGNRRVQRLANALMQGGLTASGSVYLGSVEIRMPRSDVSVSIRSDQTLGIRVDNKPISLNSNDQELVIRSARAKRIPIRSSR